MAPKNTLSERETYIFTSAIKFCLQNPENLKVSQRLLSTQSLDTDHPYAAIALHSTLHYKISFQSIAITIISTAIIPLASLARNLTPTLPSPITTNQPLLTLRPSHQQGRLQDPRRAWRLRKPPLRAHSLVRHQKEALAPPERRRRQHHNQLQRRGRRRRSHHRRIITSQEEACLPQAQGSSQWR